MKRSVITPLVVASVFAGALLADAGHTWQDLKGNKLNGEFVSKAGNVVTIRTEKGPIKVGFNSLVAEDQVYINKQMSTPTRRLGEKKFGEKPKFGDRARAAATPTPAPVLGKGATTADKANAQIAAYREKKAAEEAERRKKTEEAKERFKKQMADRKRRSNSRRR